ncbi:EF-hand calcium-binding domain-containing protein 6 [Erpetoichthys calabaricus]|uniref:EF-hand calcium-binding domain-containing protein 6 n=1 Tax=Erpetoichthys calabaricus TaxID=27687 RepID=UPI0022342CA4|nr:EF-hand calcium-binding domain-containing protein 6 [Erpetoichthys calabaricus]
MSTAGMSPVASGRLPVIQHPLSRLGDPGTISLRGFSRDSFGKPLDEENQHGRPLAHEEKLGHSSRQQTSRNYKSLPEPERGVPTTPPPHHIPPGVEVTPAVDSSKTRLPIFGQRADLGSRAESRVSQASSNVSSVSRPGTQMRLEVDELEHLLREKMKSGGFFTMRQLFKNNDPEGNGQVSRDVLLMILTKFLGRFISSKQFQQLLLRLHLSEKTIIKFEELYAAVRDPISDGAPTWLNPVQRLTEKNFMTASQVHAQLKEKAKQRFLELGDLIPQKNPGGSSRIVAPEFQNMLNQLGFYLQEEEFEKLWKRYDKEGLGIIKGETLMKQLGIDFRNNSATHFAKQDENSDIMESLIKPTRTLSKAEEERKASITIEKWLKDKFREGFRSMKKEFGKLDPGKTDKVTQEQFLSVLEAFDLHMKKEHLGLFLARCGLENKPTVNYAEFLQKFQDRSEKGITHNILSNPKHKFNQDEQSNSASTVTAIEARLTNMFQSDFLSLLATFHKIDKLERGVISQPEFRAAIESRFSLEISDDEFELLLDRIPLDEDGNVIYPQFMAIFDSRKGAPSLFDAKTEIMSAISTSSMEEIKKSYNMKTEKLDNRNMRTPEQLFHIIKRLLNKQYQSIEKQFEDLDEKNTRRLTQEVMYQLLKRFDIQPEVSRGEIRRLWETLITNQDKTLDFLEFVRHFGYSPKSACFPNAKISPPKKGDDNFRLRSKKLNCASDILVDSVRAKVEYLLDDLQKEFEDLDPFHTGFVSKAEFRDILTELCVQLNEHECNMLEKKFEVNGDGRVSYQEFLKPFTMQRQMWRGGPNMAGILHHSYRDDSEQSSDNNVSDLGILTSRLRNKLQGEWKNLRRAFKKLDSDSSGFLSIAEFRSVMKLCNLLLDEDEVYHLMSKYDQNMDGRINYKKLLDDACKKQASTTEHA